MLESVRNRIPLESAAALVTLLYVAVSVYIPNGANTVILLGYFAVMLVIAALAGFEFLRKNVELPVVVLCIGMLASIGLMFAISQYPKANAVRLFSYFSCMAIVFMVLKAKVPDRALLWFLRIAVVVIIAICAVKFAIPDYYSVHSPFARGNEEGAPQLPSGLDKNATALFIFMTFCMSWKRRYVSGIVVGLLYPFVYLGRQYLLMMAVFLFIEACLWILERITARSRTTASGQRRALRLHFHPAVIFLAFALSFGGMYAFSSYWVENITSQGTEEYKTSLNDGSNAMRMISNVYAVERILSDPAFLVYGYDTDIYTALGISPDRSGRNYNVYVNGYRIVQPHEEVINTVLKEGALFAVLYYAAISLLLSRITTRRNFSVVMAFFFASLVAHSMFSTYTLVLLCVAMAVAEAGVPQQEPAEMGARGIIHSLRWI